MNKKELEQRIIEIDVNLKALGDLAVLVTSSNETKIKMESLITNIESHEKEIDAIPEKKEELEALVQEASELKDSITAQQTVIQETQIVIESLKTKTEELQKLSLDQLGVISNEKLSNSFDKVTGDLKDCNEKWFWWLLGTSIALIVSVLVIVIWQTEVGDTIFEISFLVKIALTSPIIFFEFFINREYSRSQRLIEEYEFKASIARSLEAYKEIIENLFSDQPGEEYKKKLDFILESIGQLYSSPMKNIRDNECSGNKTEKIVLKVLSDLKDTVSDVKVIVSKI